MCRRNFYMIYMFYTAKLAVANNKKIRFHYVPSSPYSALLTLKNRRLTVFTVPIAISELASPSTVSAK